MSVEELIAKRTKTLKKGEEITKIYCDSVPVGDSGNSIKFVWCTIIKTDTKNLTISRKEECLDEIYPKCVCKKPDIDTLTIIDKDDIESKVYKTPVYENPYNIRIRAAQCKICGKLVVKESCYFFKSINPF